MDGHARPWSDYSENGRLLKVAGDRTVPVEVGLNHLVGGGGRRQQRLMTFRDYIQEFVEKREEKVEHQGNGQGEEGEEDEEEQDFTVAVSAVVPVTAAHTKGYLAQHRLSPS